MFVILLFLLYNRHGIINLRFEVTAKICDREEIHRTSGLPRREKQRRLLYGNIRNILIVNEHSGAFAVSEH
jgi:hypothetical protein